MNGSQLSQHGCKDLKGQSMEYTRELALLLLQIENNTTDDLMIDLRVCERNAGANRVDRDARGMIARQRIAGKWEVSPIFPDFGQPSVPLRVAQTGVRIPVCE
jgi:hypothetical protein